MDSLIQLLVFAVLLTIGFIFGSAAEKRHYASIRRREKELRGLIIVPEKRLPRQDCDTAFVCGSVVIAQDYFKMALAGFAHFFGGRIGAYETLLERARREAILRMKEQAAQQRARLIFNVKFSTCNLMGQESRKAGCVEVTAYGTAVIPHARA